MSRSMDRVVNLAIGVGMTVCVVTAGRGIHMMANGYGKKDGF